MPTVVVLGMSEYVKQFAAGARPARCPDKKRGHTVCTNRANICWENFIRQAIGFPDIYFCEPCRAGPEYEKADFELFGAANIEEMLTMLRDTTQAAQAQYRRTTF